MSDRTDAAITSLIEPWMGQRRSIINAAIEKYFPHSVDSRKLEYICGAPSYRYDVAAANYGIYQAGWDLLDRGGKRWRPLLMMLIIEALGKDPREYADFLVIPEVVHNGTLIIDDIEDRSELRRGKPCIHRLREEKTGELRYDVDLAINAGNAMYYIPLLPLIKLRDKLPLKVVTDIYEIYAQEMINIAHGQGTDIYWHHGKGGHLSPEEYLQMCAYKTGTLARMSAKIGALLGGADAPTTHALGKFAESIAVAFQIQDDVLNLKESVGKEFGEDIKEGKRSLLVIRALEKLPPHDANRLTELLGLHTDRKELIQEAIDLIRRTDSFEYCKTLGLKIIEDSWKDVERILPRFKPFKGFEPDAKSGLRVLADFLVQRSS